MWHMGHLRFTWDALRQSDIWDVGSLSQPVSIKDVAHPRGCVCAVKALLACHFLLYFFDTIQIYFVFVLKYIFNNRKKNIEVVHYEANIFKLLFIRSFPVWWWTVLQDNSQYDYSVRCLFLLLIPQVMPVSYVRFSTSPVLHTHSRESLKALPLGIVLTFTVHFHASTGEALHSSNSFLTFATNRSVINQFLSY